MCFQPFLSRLRPSPSSASVSTSSLRATASTLVHDALAVLTEAQANGQPRTALAAIRETRACLETLAGLLAPRTTRRGVEAWAIEPPPAQWTQTIEELFRDPELHAAVVERTLDQQMEEQRQLAAGRTAGAEPTARGER